MSLNDRVQAIRLALHTAPSLPANSTWPWRVLKIRGDTALVLDRATGEEKWIKWGMGVGQNETQITGEMKMG